MVTKYNDGSYLPIKKLKEIIFSSLKGLTQESRVKFHFPLNYNEIISWEFPENFTFIQKLYHYLNEDPDLLLIGRCLKCGKLTTFRNITMGYSQYCSIKCQQNCELNKQKCKETWNNKTEEEIKQWKENLSNSWTKESKRIMVERCKQTCLESYGVESYSQTDEFKNKVKQTKLERYGDENYCPVEKIRKTKLERYNDPNYCNVEKCKETWHNKTKDEIEGIVNLRKQTCLDLYGVPSYTQTQECKDKVKQTNYERHGVYGIGNAIESFYEKFKQTCLEKYGEINFSKTQAGKEKIREGIYKNTGHHTSWGCSEPYIYDGVSFDSSWEVAFFIYHKDNGDDIKRCDISFEYMYNNKVFHYYPDFELNGEIIEIKGLHFFKDMDINKEMINPFDSNQNGLFEAKHQCMVSNNVKIITDCNEYISYVNNKYGRDFLKSLKNTKNNRK